MPFRTGRREVDWDDVPDDDASPNFLDPKYDNTSAAKGMVANAIGLTGPRSTTCG